jgi:hypothetical protein
VASDVLRGKADGRTACRFIYNGHTGPRGKVCGRPESDHCGKTFNECADSRTPCPTGKDHKVHHTFTRKRKCPTCGCTETHEASA